VLSHWNNTSVIQEAKLLIGKKIPEKTLKNLYHAIRLITEAKRMVEGNAPKVWWEGKEREYLMAIRRSEIDPEKNS